MKTELMKSRSFQPSRLSDK